MDKARAIDEVRAFTRFYTRFAGVLNEGLLKSRFSPTEARVLYEIGSRGETGAAELAGDLRLDPAHLSRILGRFRKAGLVAARTAETDRRARRIVLTDRGREAFERLDAASENEVGAVLSALSASERNDLVADMLAIRAKLDRNANANSGTAPGYLIRPYRNGDASWIVHRQALIYAAEYGWNGDYETLIAGIVADFLKHHEPAREQFWVAERAGRVVGSVFLVDGGEGVGKLRLLYVEPSARGLGIGRALVESCIDFARRAGYRRMTLWTNDVLVSARRIYEAAGFERVGEERHHSFGKDLVGQTWERAL